MMKPFPQPVLGTFSKLWCLFIFNLLPLQPRQLVVLAFSPVSSASSNNFEPSTGIFAEPQWSQPTFTEEPPNRIDFLNEDGAAIVCQADGHPQPRIQWLGSDNKIVSNIDRFLTVLSNSTLLIHPFKPQNFRQDVHSIRKLACIASNSVGVIRSRDIQVRAVIAQQWSAKVVSTPSHLSPRVGPILLKCDVDLMGGGRDFIEVTGWKRDDKFIRGRSQRLYESGDEDDVSHWHILPNGDLVIESLLEDDAGAKVICRTRHKITLQEITSSTFTLFFSEKPNHAHRDDLNIAESFPSPIVILREGDSIVLHCYSLSSSSSLPPSSNLDANNVRWEKLSGNSWLEIHQPVGGGGSTLNMLRQIGNSLVGERSTKTVGGHYRCRGGSSKESVVAEFEVLVIQPLSVKLTITQPKSPLESTAELTCTVTSSSHNSPSVVWLKDANFINPGGRVRFFATNVLQINQIQQDDQGIYQCLARTEMESTQDFVRLELADAEPRLIYGFNEQTLGSAGPAISFRCGFSGWPTPSISWHRDSFDSWPVTLSYDSRILIGNITSHGHLISYLNISETRMEDSGLYVCSGSSRAGKISHSSRLNIYGPLWVRVVPPLVAISGEFFIIHCPITGWPIPFSSISWEKDGHKLPFNPRQRVGTNGSLTITLVDKSDSGPYHCSLPDAQGRPVRREIRVNVVAPLRIAPFPERGSVMEGERLTLVCALSSGDAPLNINWNMVPSTLPLHWHRSSTEKHGADMKQGLADGRKLRLSTLQPLEGGTLSLFSILNTDPFTSLLSISKVTERHAGRYICNASSTSAGTTLRSHDLTVLVPPKIEPFTFQENLKEKMMTRLVCGVSQGDLPLEFSWYFDRKKIDKLELEPWTNNIEISTLDSFSTLLRFSSLSLSNSGFYTCLVKNAASQSHYSAKLLVQVAPRWVKEPEDVNVTRGKPLMLDCAGFGVPEPKASWIKATGDGGTDIHRFRSETIWPSDAGQAISLANGSLLFYNVEEHHEGQYICSISNGIGTGLSKIVQLYVHVPPYFVGSESQPISLTQGKTHEISCEASSSSPIYLTWSRGNNVFVNVPANRIHTVVVMEGRRTKSTLAMKDIRSDDTGLYRCQASNALGKVSRTYRLVVEEQPNAPQRLRLAEESQRNGPEATFLFLEWDPPSGEYSSKESRLPRDQDLLLPRPSKTTSSTSTTSTIFPPILMYVLEFSLTSEEKTMALPLGFSRRLEVPAGEKNGAKVDNLSPSEEYVFVVRAVNSAGSSPKSNRLVVRTGNIPPSVSPSNGRAVAVSSRTLQVSWSPIPIEMTFGKIVAYHVFLSTNTDSSLKGNTATILVPSTASYTSFNNNATVNEQNCCSFVVHGLSPFTHYEIKVSALNIAGEGPLSSPFSAKTSEEAPQLPPRNPQCTSHANRIQITWQNPIQPNGPINSYKILFYPLEFDTQINRGLLGQIHRTTGLTAVIGGLKPSTNYTFHISPINIAGEGSQSLCVFCKTSEDVPSTPSNLIGFPTSETSIYLNWLHPRNPNGILTHNTIYFRMIDKIKDSFEVKRTVPGNVDYYEENGLDLARYKYVFWVTSSNRMGESQSTSQVIFNPPPVVETRLVGQSKSIEIQLQGTGNPPLILPCRLIGPNSDEQSVVWTLDGKRVGLDGGNVYMKQSDLVFFGVRKSDQGNYTCQMKNGNKNGNRKSKTSTKKVINGMESQTNHPQQLTYNLQVKGVACTPEPSYRILDRDIFIAWTMGERSRSSCDAPLGFIFYYRALGSILDWKKVIFQPTTTNYTLKEIACGSILNMYMVAFNEVGNSPDSHLMSVVVSHSLAPFPPPTHLIVPNITTVLLNLYSLNANITFCPVEKFSVAVREWRTSDWFPGKDVKIQFRNEFVIENLKPSTPYELLFTTFGYSTSRSTTITFTTLTSLGDNPSPDVLSKHKVTSEYSPLYNNLTLILPTILSITAIFAATIAVTVYCKTRRHRQTPMVDRNCELKTPNNDVNYGYLQQRKNEEQFYAGLPCTPGLDDISPYATFQGVFPKKFHEETFSQEIVVGKFHPVNHGLPRASRDKWMSADRDSRQMQDSEDSESENAQRYSIIPVQRSRLGNLYQINPPSQPPPPLPYQQPMAGYQQPQHLHHHQILEDNSDYEEGDNSSSEEDPSRTTMDRRAKKDRKSSNKKSAREINRFQPIKESGSSTSLRKNKRKSTLSDYSIAV